MDNDYEEIIDEHLTELAGFDTKYAFLERETDDVAPVYIAIAAAIKYRNKCHIEFVEFTDGSRFFVISQRNHPFDVKEFQEAIATGIPPVKNHIRFA